MRIILLLITSTQFNLLSDVLSLDCPTGDISYVSIDIDTDIEKVDFKNTDYSRAKKDVQTFNLTITPTKYLWISMSREHWINRKNISFEYYDSKNNFYSYQCNVLKSRVKI